MNSLLGILAVVSMLLAAGCGTVILKADFQSSPSGTILPGPPDDDHILVGAANAVSGGLLRLQSPPSTSAAFFSRPVQDPEAKKWIAWTGQFKSGTASVSVWIFGRPSVGGGTLITAPFLDISSNEVTVLETSSSQPPQTHPLIQNGVHRVFVSVRPKSGTFWISITQSGAAEIVVTGQLGSATATSLKDHPRVVLWVSIGTLLGSSATSEYQMDDVSIEEPD